MHPARPARALLLAAAALAATLLPAAARAAPVPMASFEDAEGDQAGPGDDLDLRRVAVLADGAELLFVVTLGAPLGPGGLSRQAVEIYLDTDAAPGAGVATGLPGPPLAFAGERHWEAAVALSPQPEARREEVRRALGPAAGRVVVPASLTWRGRAVTARVQAAAVGGLPGPGWGYAVVVVDAAGDGTRRVRDVLLPPGQDQAAALGGAEGSAAVTVPFLFGPALMLPQTTPAPVAAPSAASAPTPPPAPAPAPAPASSLSAVTLAPNLMPRLTLSPPAAPSAAEPSGQAAAGAAVVLTVTDLSGELLTAKGSPAGLQPMQFGRVVDAQGMTVARVMVLRLLDQGLLATVIAGKELVRAGQVVRFDGGAAAPAEPPPAAGPRR